MNRRGMKKACGCDGPRLEGKCWECLLQQAQQLQVCLSDLVAAIDDYCVGTPSPTFEAELADARKLLGEA